MHLVSVFETGASKLDAFQHSKRPRIVTVIAPKGVEEPFIDHQRGEFRIEATSSADAHRLEIVSSVFR